MKYSASIKMPILQESVPIINDSMGENGESDLTELSWLTSNVPMFSSKSLNNNNFLLSPVTVLDASTYPTTNTSSSNDHQSLNTSKSSDEDSSLSSSSSSFALNNSPISPVSSSSSASSISSPSKVYIENEMMSTNKKVRKLLKSTTERKKTPNQCGLNNKPPLTLSCLIFMALQESCDQCLPVREIYEWIETNFPFYKNISNTGWKSSIRHNLSFSKCFKKMDRTESVFYRNNNKSGNNNNSIVKPNPTSLTGRKRRAPNSIGTCWKVNPECKSYLIHTLKKSSFWFNNSKSYPKLCNLIAEFESTTTANNTNTDDNLNNFITNGHNRSIKDESIKIAAPQSINHDEDAYDENSLKLTSLDTNDLATVAVLANTYSPQDCWSNKLDLSFSSSTSSSLSLVSAFSSLSGGSSTSPSSPNDDYAETHNSKRIKLDVNNNINNNNNINQASEDNFVISNDLNSDLEIEVASTLVGMKWLFRKP